MKTRQIRQRSRDNVTDLFPQKQNLSQSYDSRNAQTLRDIHRLKRKELKERYPAEWNCFRAMQARARDGIAIVNPQLNRFQDYLRELGPCPSPGYTVDRIDTLDPEYAPGKVRWASKAEQANNRTNTTFLRGKDGKLRPLAEWARITKQKPDTLRKRKERGWPDEDIIAGKRRESGNAGHPIDPIVSDKWPAIIEDHRPLERAWQAWTKQPDWKNLQRETFLAWLLENRRRRREARLTTRYPDQFGPGSDPYADHCPPLTDDPDYSKYMRGLAVSAELRAALDHRQIQHLHQLAKDHGMIVDTSQIQERIEHNRRTRKAMKRDSDAEDAVWAAARRDMFGA